MARRRATSRTLVIDVWERVEEGVVKGIAILNFKKRTRGKTAVIDLPLNIQLESAEV